MYYPMWHLSKKLYPTCFTNARFTWIHKKAKKIGIRQNSRRHKKLINKGPYKDLLRAICMVLYFVKWKQKERKGTQNVRTSFGLWVYRADGDGHSRAFSWPWRAENVRILRGDVPCIAILTRTQTGATCQIAPCVRSARQPVRTGARSICRSAYKDT